MSLYTRVHTPNSPLLPLSPMPSTSSLSAFRSPYKASHGRRSFTPNILNILPTPNLSPIRTSVLSNKRKSCDANHDSALLGTVFKRPLLAPPPSSRESIKKIRSSARKVELKNAHGTVTLDAIRRSLVYANSPPVQQVKTNPNVSRIDLMRLKTPQSKLAMRETPRRYSSAAVAANEFEYNEAFASPNSHHSHNATRGLMEETFTVLSILKEVNMHKYADLFVKEEIDLFVFLNLNADDMIELGIEDGDRDILMDAIAIFTQCLGNHETSFL